MKLLIICSILFSVMTSVSAAGKTQKQRPFNDEGPRCKEGCGKPDKLKAEPSFIILSASKDPKPPFNDEGPGGSKG